MIWTLWSNNNPLSCRSQFIFSPTPDYLCSGLFGSTLHMLAYRRRTGTGPKCIFERIGGVISRIFEK